MVGGHNKLRVSDTLKKLYKSVKEGCIVDVRNISVKLERIICAAIWFNDGKPRIHQPVNIQTGVVMCGFGHACIFAQLGGRVADRQQLGYKEEKQGFLTTHNRFVDREEAAMIAYVCGQIKEPKSQLFSEDLR